MVVNWLLFFQCRVKRSVDTSFSLICLVSFSTRLVDCLDGLELLRLAVLGRMAQILSLSVLLLTFKHLIVEVPTLRLGGSFPSSDGGSQRDN